MEARVQSLFNQKHNYDARKRARRWTRAVIVGMKIRMDSSIADKVPRETEKELDDFIGGQSDEAAPVRI